MRIPFTKMQAYGNDYVYINAMKVDIKDWNRLAIAISDRHFGVGSDGMILICDSQSDDFRMRVFDPDGTECEMCGNALRSVSKYVYYYGLTRKTEFTIETIGGHKQVSLEVANSEVVSIHANIGRPVFDASKVVVDLERLKSFNPEYDAEQGELMECPIEVEGRTFKLSSLSWGNPHTVMFIDDVDSLDIEKYGPAIENHPIFPNRTNVTFAQIIDRSHIKIREWERGCGETIGCGTGCCTALVFAARLGMCDRKAEVMQIGGPLKVEWDEEDRVHMIGPSTVVYEGEYIYEAE